MNNCNIEKAKKALLIHYKCIALIRVLKQEFDAKAGIVFNLLLNFE